MPSLDGRLVVSHDVEMSGTTNVEHLYRDRKSKIKAICFDDEQEEMEGWFIHHFNLNEIQRMRVGHHALSGRINPEGEKTRNGVPIKADAFTVPTLLEAATFIQRKRCEVNIQ
jgi:hypothetical protein